MQEKHYLSSEAYNKSCSTITKFYDVHSDDQFDQVKRKGNCFIIYEGRFCYVDKNGTEYSFKDKENPEHPLVAVGYDVGGVILEAFDREQIHFRFLSHEEGEIWECEYSEDDMMILLENQFPENLYLLREARRVSNNKYFFMTLCLFLLLIAVSLSFCLGMGHISSCMFLLSVMLIMLVILITLLSIYLHADFFMLSKDWFSPVLKNSALRESSVDLGCSDTKPSSGELSMLELEDPYKDISCGLILPQGSYKSALQA